MSDLWRAYRKWLFVRRFRRMALERQLRALGIAYGRWGRYR